jgi:hypothetical protein
MLDALVGTVQKIVLSEASEEARDRTMFQGQKPQVLPKIIKVMKQSTNSLIYGIMRFCAAEHKKWQHMPRK